MAITVDQRSDEVERISAAWQTITALMGGTDAMRAAGEMLLPKQPRESQEDYDYRRKTATLFPAYRRTVGVMAGKPFSKEVTFSKDLPPRLGDLADDIDGQGRNLHSFAADVMTEVMAFGYGGVLVDFTRTEGQARTQADEKAMGARPYWVHFKHDQILGWRAKKVKGVTQLTQLRLLEFAEEEDGEYGATFVKQVRVLRPGSWETWRKVGENKEFTLHESGTTTLKEIPFVPFYGTRLAFMMGLPPLVDLAHQNVKHWQHQSDQDDSARFARKRLLVFIGVTKDELGGGDKKDGDVTAGSAYALRFENPNAKAEVVQGQAECVTVGRSELEALEEQMIETGAELLVQKPGERSATEAAIDAEANKSDLQRIVESFEDSLDQCLQLTADWLKIPEGGHVSLFKDFAAASLSEATAQLLLSLQQGGIITKETVIRENQRRGILAPEIVPAKELEAVSEEGPALGTLGDNTGGGGGSDE